MLTLAHAWSRTQKVLLIAATVVAIGAFVAFAYSYERSHRLPDESILFGRWQMTAPHDPHSSTILGLYEFLGLHGERYSHWHGGYWTRYDVAKETGGYSEMSWYAGGSYIYMRVADERLPQIWQIVDIGPEELRLRHAKRDYVFRRLPGNASNQCSEPRARLRLTFCVFAIHALAAWRAFPGSRSLILCLVRPQSETCAPRFFISPG